MDGTEGRRKEGGREEGRKGGVGEEKDWAHSDLQTQDFPEQTRHRTSQSELKEEKGLNRSALGS